jgi:hypothetical protein
MAKPSGSVYRFGDHYRIVVAGELRKRFPKRGRRFRAPYRTLLTGALLDLIVLADVRPEINKAQPIEIAVDMHSTDASALGELVLLDWQVALDASWLAKRQTYQPLGVWLYKGGAVVAAGLKGTPRRALKDWLVRGKEQGDPKLVEQLSRRARPPEVKRATHAINLRVAGKPVATLSPVQTLYPFRASPAERRGFDLEAADLSHKERLPPSLRAACEQMDFGALRRFLDGCLSGQEEHTRADCPSTEEEFLGLLEMLREKVDDTSLPRSTRLIVLRDEERHVAAKLRASEADPAATKRGRSKLRKKLRQLRAETATLNMREREDKSARLDTREGIVDRVGRDIRRAFRLDADIPASRLPWRLLPSGELSVQRLRNHYKTLQHRNPHVRYDPERIAKAFSLGPERCYIGTEEFDGYVVFTFAGTDKALLECPVYGNAIYVLGPDWRRLSKMSKQDLLTGRPRGVDKIVHKGNWFGRAKRALEI